ncbi:glycoside hydrolase domain-containing protein [Nocardia sp. NPDC050630]|uniref:glycoside hydrolase domain-containing protein n=1 Tax=Nocardia sp. NPDC050630 TaxID=3364321 RepID=UPI0037A45F84
MTTAVDFAARLIDPVAIRDAGHSAVIVYVAPSRPGSNFGAKPIAKPYTDQLRAAGLDIASVWQYGKPGNSSAPSDWTTGYDGGQRMGIEAAERHRAAGGPDQAPIFFAVDEDISLDDWNTQAVEFFRGVNNAIGTERTGIYGHSRACAWAAQDAVIGSAGGGKFWAWQTRAWSGGEIAPEAVLYQRVIDTPTSPGPLIDGSAVDVNDVLSAVYGQWSHYEQPEDLPMVKPEFEEIDYYADSNSSRKGARVTNGLGHTQEGGPADGSGAQGLADYLSNTANEVSYHDIIGNGQVFHIARKDRSSWSVLDANPYTVNYCLAGSRASWSRDQWLERRDDIRIMAWLMVQDAKEIGYDTAVIGPPYEQRDGLSDHYYVTQCLGIGTHTDLGPAFPWDVLAADVAEFATGAPASPPPNAINDVAAVTSWLGARITAGEESTPDGKGRFAAFEFGHIYWHPSTGAHAIPMSLFGKYAAAGWETGVLGYPITDVTDLEHGVVQGFQGGALYFQDGRVPVVVRGAIRARWHREGSEDGPFGYPVADEEALAGGEARQRFENGQIIWPGRRDTAALLDSEGPDTPVPDRD